MKKYLLLLLLLPIIVYAKVFSTPFVYDDNKYIVNNLLVTNNTGNIFQNPRPVTYLSFRMNYLFGKLEVGGYHLVNLLLHLTSVLLVFVAAKKLLKLNNYPDGEVVAFVAALFFSVHPLATEVVTYIYNRAASLAFVFSMGSLVLFLKYYEKKKGLYFLLSLFLFAVGLLAKESAAALPFAFVIISLLFFQKDKKTTTYSIAAFFVVLIVFYLYMKTIVTGSEIYISNDEAFASYIVKQPWVLLKSIGLFILPFSLSIDHIFSSFQLSDPRFIVSMILLTAGAIGSYKVVRSENNHAKPIVFCFMWLIVTMLPIMIFKTHFGERHLYMPLFGLCLFLSILYKSLHKLLGKNAVRAIIIFHLIILSLLTYQRNVLYADPVLLWKDALQKYPHNFRAHNELGMVYVNREQYDLARLEFEQSIADNPAYGKALVNLGNIYFYTEPNKALSCYLKAYELNSRNESVLINLGNLYYYQKDFMKSESYFKQVLELNPRNAYAQTMLKDEQISQLK